MGCRIWKCKGCSEPKYIVNMFWELCQGCNNERLHGNKYGKQVDIKEKKPSALKTYPKLGTSKKKVKARKSLFAPTTKIKESINLYELDSEFYRKCFESFNGYCENCGTKQPGECEDSEGRVINRWRYSHIIPKSVAQELRHKVYNINDLCLKCHMEWENGSKENMNIYEGNVDTFPERF